MAGKRAEINREAIMRRLQGGNGNNSKGQRQIGGDAGKFQNPSDKMKLLMLMRNGTNRG